MDHRQKLGFAGVAWIALVALAQAEPVVAEGVSPPLGTAGNYMVLATNPNPTPGTVTCTDTGPGVSLDGNIGTTFTSITNTGCTINGTIDAPVAGAVVTDFGNAYAALPSLNPSCDGTIPTTSTTIPPGVYCSAAGVSLGAGVIFTLDGGASDVWIFRVGTSGVGALTGNSFQVVMAGSALPCNVYWWTAEAATMTDSNFVGTILAGTAISLTRGDYLGRALAATDIVVTDAAPMTFAGCEAPPATITVSKDFIPNNLATVEVDLVCSSGTVTNTPLSVSESVPGVFVVNGATAAAICTASETLVPGYLADATNCLSVPLGGSCTITNTQVSAVAIPVLSSSVMVLVAALLALVGLALMRKRTT